MFLEKTDVSKVRRSRINCFLYDVVLKGRFTVSEGSVWECVEAHSTNEQDYDCNEDYAKRVDFDEELKIWAGSH